MVVLSGRRSDDVLRRLKGGLRVKGARLKKEVQKVGFKSDWSPL